MFAYGMNTNCGQMAIRCPDAVLLGKAELPNCRMDFRYHADITHDFNDNVEGILWEIDPQTLKNLDIAEGYPHYYVRKQLWVFVGDVRYLAWTYIMRVPKELEIPSSQYWNSLFDGYKQNDINMDQLYRALERANAVYL